MSWKKYFKSNNLPSNISPLGGGRLPDPGMRNYQSQLPEVYTGQPNRVERYNQYEQMDMDSEVNAALDILAEFCTQKNLENHTPFTLRFKDQPSDNEVKILKEQLQQWVALNEFNKRTFKIVRNVLKYGDQIFIRDPENFKLYWTEMSKVTRVIVNEGEGKKPEQYLIKDLNPNFQNLTVTAVATTDTYMNHPQVGGPSGAYVQPQAPFGGGSRFSHAKNEAAINAEHVVHLSLTEGLDVYWPFGNSVLENIFKVFKQKELLEDAIIIYRVQRAPERRVFKIDVGNMPSHMAMAFVERVKNEIHQRRIPTQTGTGTVNMMDASYNPLCLDLATEIPLLDGRTLALSEIIAEFQAGRENWTYSCDPITGKIVPGVIDWAGVTRTSAEVLELVLDNGKTITCTPDHKIPVLGRGFVEAQHLTTADSLIAFNTQHKLMTTGRDNNYEQVWDHESKSWIWTHRLVAEFFRKLGKHQEFTYLPEHAESYKAVIHHRDHNRFNNYPRNLTYMNKSDHVLYHAAQKREFWENMTTEYRDSLTSKISQTLRDHWAIMDEQTKLTALYNIRQAQKKAVYLRKTDPDVQARFRKNASAARYQYFAEHPEFLAQSCKNLEKRVKLKNQNLILTQDMLGIVVGIVKSGITNKNQVLKICDGHTGLLELVRKNNPEISGQQCKIDFSRWGYSKMDKLLTQFGYKNWKSFVKNVDLYNHRIVEIRKVAPRDVGTITVDGTERWHAHHTFATAAGIFVKNSTNEDYFFPQTAEGRGSSVDVLQGGQNLGEITDLRFFTNKLFRGLRIPSSYLPTTADDGSQAYTDGRVGTALIQEWRFNQYCQRLQGMIADKLDSEFKLFMRWRGFNIDGSLFDLAFNEPQNFAQYRQADIDQARIATFTALEAFPYLSKRFLMKRYLGMTEQEISENEMAWAEERGDTETAQPNAPGLRNVGISPGGIQTDLEGLGPEPGPGEPGVAGGAPEATGPGGPGAAAGINAGANAPAL